MTPDPVRPDPAPTLPAAPAAGVYGFPDGAEPARRLADALGLPFARAEVHRFPDGESLVRLPQPFARAVVYRPLDRPNDKLIELMLAAAALRDQGAAHLTLVAPYLPYMRQDIAFRPGEPVSQRVVGRWLAGMFDRVVAVDPHLHRTSDLGQVFPGAAADALSAAGLLADHLRAQGVTPDTVLVAPDEEAEGFVRAAAGPLGLAVLAGRKDRRGDRDVAVTLPEHPDLTGRPAVIVDDVISSGGTIVECARALRARGAGPVAALAVHAVYPPDAEAAFRAAGIKSVASCDGVPHPSNRIALAPLLAKALSL